MLYQVLCFYATIYHWRILCQLKKLKKSSYKTLINIILRDLGLRHKSVEYECNLKLDTICAISNDKQVTVRFGDNLDIIEYIMITAGDNNVLLYEKYNRQFADVLDNKDIKHALMAYDFDL